MNNPERSFSQRLHTWIQIVAIIFAGAWVAYTWLYKEIWVPYSKPGHLNLTLEVSRPTWVSLGDQEEGVISVELLVNVKNNGTKAVHLLPSGFIVFGHEIDTGNPVRLKPLNYSKAWLSNPGDQLPQQLHYPNTKRIAVVLGEVFDGWTFSPGQDQSRSFLIQVPDRKYHNLEFWAILQGVTDKKGISADLKLSEDNRVIVQAYLLREDGSLGRALEHARPKDKDYLNKKGYSRFDSYRKVSIMPVMHEKPRF